MGARENDDGARTGDSEHHQLTGSPRVCGPSGRQHGRTRHHATQPRKVAQCSTARMFEAEDSPRLGLRRIGRHSRPWSCVRTESVLRPAAEEEEEEEEEKENDDSMEDVHQKAPCHTQARTASSMQLWQNCWFAS